MVMAQGPKSGGTPARLRKTRMLSGPHGKFETVVCQAHMGRQEAFGPVVLEVVTDVGKERPFRSERLDRLNGAVHGRVRGMRLITKRVEEEHVEAAEHFHGGFGNLAVIGEIGGRAETEPVNGLTAVKNGDRKELETE